MMFRLVIFAYEFPGSFYSFVVAWGLVNFIESTSADMAVMANLQASPLHASAADLYASFNGSNRESARY